MGRYSSNPILYDDVMQLHIKKLKEWHYLEPNQSLKGAITWKRKKEYWGSISISIYSKNEHFFLELDYTCNKEPINYTIRIESITSNLGKGKVWYFICPKTFKRCRKLYLVDKYFLHREAFNNTMYQSQVNAKCVRPLKKYFDVDDKCYLASKTLKTKYFKPYYNGKPTKRYLRSIKAIQEFKQYDKETVLKLFKYTS